MDFHDNLYKTYKSCVHLTQIKNKNSLEIQLITDKIQNVIQNQKLTIQKWNTENK